MALPAIVASVVSVLGWIGVDLGISWLTREDTTMEYVQGLDALTFLQTDWTGLLLFSAIVLTGVWLAVPGNSKDGHGPR